MNEYHNARLKPFSQKMRREMTKEERHLWYDFLKRLPVTVHRQKVLGHYIADFYIASKKILIELDGSQHFMDAGVQSDRDRDAWMQENGITVLRYTNLQIQREFNAVCSDILLHMEDNTSSPPAAELSLKGKPPNQKPSP
ncbi:MAG: endonuclease domain-containing protein [Clostridia bacterium]|nr:endonuclease domain-containing protein [Clostridia bacterium]